MISQINAMAREIERDFFEKVKQKFVFYISKIRSGA